MFTYAISSQILALERPSSMMYDFMYWKISPDGLFSIRSAYAFLLCNSHVVASMSSAPSSSWWKHFWGLYILSRFKIFLWNVLMNAFPLVALLCQRGMSVDPLCSLCHQEPESSSHLFRDCPLLLQL